MTDLLSTNEIDYRFSVAVCRLLHQVEISIRTVCCGCREFSLKARRSQAEMNKSRWRYALICSDAGMIRHDAGAGVGRCVSIDGVLLSSFSLNCAETRDFYSADPVTGSQSFVKKILFYA